MSHAKQAAHPWDDIAPENLEILMANPTVAEAVAKALAEYAVEKAKKKDRWLNRKRAAAYMEISARTLAKHIDEWGLPQYGPAVRCFDPADLDALMRANVLRAKGAPIIPFPSLNAQQNPAVS